MILPITLVDLVLIGSISCRALGWATPNVQTPQVTLSPAKEHAARPRHQHGYRGWSSWSLQAFKGRGYGFEWLNETNVKAQADVVAAELKSLGYDRINIDSGWQGDIDDFGRHLPHPERFRSGIPALQGYLAERGLKLGLYYLPGIDGRAVERRTPVLGTEFTADQIIQCPDSPSTPIDCLRPPPNAFWAGTAINYSHPGAQAYIDSVVSLLYSWNVSFVKLDGNVPGSSIDTSAAEWSRCDTIPDLRAWRSAIDRLHPEWEIQGRERIWLVASWEIPTCVADHMRMNADSWRVAIDIEAYGHVMTTFDRVIRNAKRGAIWTSIEANRGTGLIDLDAVLVTDMTHYEAEATVTIWALMGTPFYLGDDLTTLNKTRLALVQNPEVLEVQRRSGLNPARLLNYNASASTASTTLVSAAEKAGLYDKRRMVRESYGETTHLPSTGDWIRATGLGENSRPEWEQEIWYAQYENGEVVLAIINAGELKWWDAPMVLDVNLSDLPLREAAAQYGIRDLWKRKNIGIVSRDAKFSLAMERHQAFLWLLRPLA